MRFVRFINELAFANSSDFDYPGKIGEVIVTNPDDKYEVKGKTHGLISHAIKHVMEFEPEYYKEVIDQFKQRIASMKNDLFILNKNSGKIEPLKDQWKNDKVLQNTLDFINDRFKEVDGKGGKLNSKEKLFYGFAEKLATKYEELIEQLLSNVVPVDDMSLEQINKVLESGRTIKFTALYMGTWIDYFYNEKTGAYGASYKEKFKTLYKVYQINRGLKFKNEAIKEFFKMKGLL